MTGKDVTAELKALARPAAPPDLSRAVMARIARIDDERVADAGPGRATLEWPSFVTATGAALTAMSVVKVILYTAVTVPISPSSLGPGAVAFSLSEWPLALPVGIALYLAGLFAPVRGGTARRRGA